MSCATGARSGAFIEVRITEARPHSLKGEFVEVNDPVLLVRRRHAEPA